jgi:hypothetical protein
LADDDGPIFFHRGQAGRPPTESDPSIARSRTEGRSLAPRDSPRDEVRGKVMGTLRPATIAIQIGM